MKRPPTAPDTYVTSSALRCISELISRDDATDLSASWIRWMYETETRDPLIGGFVSTFPLVTSLPVRERVIPHADICEIETALVTLLKRRQRLGFDGARFSRYLSVLRNHHERSKSVQGVTRYRTSSGIVVSLVYTATSGIGGLSMEGCLRELASRVDPSLWGVISSLCDTDSSPGGA